MNRSLISTFLAICLIVLVAHFGFAADPERDSLQGVWLAQSMEMDGKLAGAAATARVRFTFKADKLLIKGNYDDEREAECTFKMDSAKNPKQLDFQAEKDGKPSLCIYELKGDELKICIRKNSSKDGRPTEFGTKADSQLIFLVLKKEDKKK